MTDIKVLIVDDSAVVRQVLTQQLKAISGIEVLGAASDPLFAKRYLERQRPDVIVLDIEMPRMDGITFLKQIMRESPIPVVICSTLTDKGADVTMEALSAGAVGIITKPRAGLKGFLEESRTQLGDAVKAAARARLSTLATPPPSTPTTPRLGAGAVVPEAPSRALSETTDRLVVIGTSTGGTQALEQVLTRLPRISPGIAVVQHMPGAFTAAFARRLDSLCEVEVKQAEPNDRVLDGLVLIAPGSRHMLVRRSGAHYRVEIRDGPLVSRHRPSVDVLFRSAAQCAGRNALGIIMTGMGDDGAQGLKEMHEAGAFTVAQDEATSVVYGMPKEAVKRGAVDLILPLHRIPEVIGQARGLKRRATGAPT
ncbi:chemotaxis-specific protein-glutamate methyltransferase CheB [Thiorhodococcus minor]|uniref:Protein-glutamate methylesterase/protein-glutamine glutaminase n=1 Tax=Thiorhodococcus minor TaxID=57489 RepID=A0A6M0K6D5_9GAMM|nr:chemotaxis response regulator protein-glutamate methylesterase [Thiorhodococcus minor]